MTKSKRMPLLTMDEVILLVDTYFQLMDIKVPSARKELIQELSDSMRALAFYPNLKTLSNFRSYAGMVMCLANVASIDPSKTSLFGHGSVRQKKDIRILS